ncbi:MAG: hypothetical protein ACKVZJ_05880 [Phycisphaerales bacterium]
MQRFNHRSSVSRLGVLLGAAAIAASAHTAAADAFHSEGDFAEGSWVGLPAFLTVSPNGSAIGGCVTSRKDLNGNWVLQQTLTLDAPNGFSSVQAPLVFTSFVHDPAVDGHIQSISASVRTFQNLSVDHYGGIRVWIEQNGITYSLANIEPGGNFFGFSFNEPTETRLTSGRVATDFVEFTANGLIFDSHPDFSGAPLRFGFGYSLTSTSHIGDGPQVVPLLLDNATFRITTVPPPCIGDLNDDGQRNTNDLVIFLANFSTLVPANTLGDLNGDNMVNTNDLVIFLGVFGIPCP